MKRFLIIIVMLAVAIGTQARDNSVEQLIYKYKEKKHVEYVHVPKIMLRLGMKVVGKGAKSEKDSLYRDMLRHINSVSMLNLGNCKGSVQRRFVKDVKRLDTQEYAPIAQTTHDGKKVMVLTHMEGEYIDELLVLNSTGQHCMLVQIKGKIRPEDVERLANGGIDADILGE